MWERMRGRKRIRGNERGIKTRREMESVREGGKR